MAKATGTRINIKDVFNHFDKSVAFTDPITGELHAVKTIPPKEADSPTASPPPIPASAESLSKLLGKFSK